MIICAAKAYKDALGVRANQVYMSHATRDTLSMENPPMIGQVRVTIDHFMGMVILPDETLGLNEIAVGSDPDPRRLVVKITEMQA